MTKFFELSNEKSILALVGAQYLLSGAKGLVASLGPILTIAQIVVACVTAVWIWNRAQGQRMANRRFEKGVRKENRRLRKRRENRQQEKSVW